MRWLLLSMWLVGCTTRDLQHWERKERCAGQGVSAGVVSADRHWSARQIYRVGAYLGMEEPVDELVVRICNATSEPIYLFDGLRNLSGQLALLVVNLGQDPSYTRNGRRAPISSSR